MALFSYFRWHFDKEDGSVLHLLEVELLQLDLTLYTSVHSVQWPIRFTFFYMALKDSLRMGLGFCHAFLLLLLHASAISIFLPGHHRHRHCHVFVIMIMMLRPTSGGSGQSCSANGIGGNGEQRLEPF